MFWSRFRRNNSKNWTFSPEGEVIEKWEIPTRKDNNGNNILPDIADAVLSKLKERQIAKEEVIGVGIGVPGPVDDAGVVYKAVNLGWGVMNINDTLGSLLGLPVKAANDANVAALGEMWCGGGKGCKGLGACYAWNRRWRRNNCE